MGHEILLKCYSLNAIAIKGQIASKTLEQIEFKGNKMITA
jgi:hypothetical protein